MYAICKWIVERGIAPEHFTLQLDAYYKAGKLTEAQYNELVGMLEEAVIR